MNKKTLSKVFNLINKYKLLLVLSILLALISVVSQLYIPVIFGKAIDNIIDIGKINKDLIIENLKNALILLIISSLSTWLMNLINNKIAYKTIEDLRNKVIKHIQKLPLSYLDKKSTGDIVQRMIGDIDQISEGLLLGFNQLFSGLIMIIVTLFFMFKKNVFISLIVFMMTPISFLVSKFISDSSYKMFTKQNVTRGKQTALINEMISNRKIVKDFGYEDKASNRMNELNKELNEYSSKAVFFSSLTNPSTRAINSVIYALVALFGSIRIMNGLLSIGDLSVLLSYSNQYMKPFNDISSVISELQNSLSCADRVFELLEEKVEVDADGIMSDAKGEIDIEHVYFSYDKNKKLIEDFSIKVNKGDSVAIVGPTGAGKTTFINLLMRFYDVDEGRIIIDGVDINSVSKKSLRQNFGMVLQETWIKNDTVRNNIRIGKADATDEEIIEVAKITHSYDFIKRLPNGLDTIINNNSLSEGQKQLLCVTRVMLANPPILILDEATSNIDTRTEIYIQKAFDKLMEGKTSFIVAHRLSTIVNADMILVMKDGKIIETGNHKSLMNQDSFYKRLYNSQFANN